MHERSGAGQLSALRNKDFRFLAVVERPTSNAMLVRPCWRGRLLMNAEDKDRSCTPESPPLY
jgi:hypothetical protein